MTLMPAMLLTLLCVVCNAAALVIGAVNDSPEMGIMLKALFQTLAGFYVMFFGLGVITAITEWKKIYCSNVKKVLFLFTFPLFMLTYVPISIIALFKKVKWEPIKHSVSKTLTDICGSAAEK